MAEGGSSDALREQLAALTRRVYRLETLLTDLTGRQLGDEVVPPPPSVAAAEPARPASPPPLETLAPPPVTPRAPAAARTVDKIGRAHV